MSKITILQSEWTLPIYFMALSLPILLAYMGIEELLGSGGSFAFTVLSIGVIMYLLVKAGIAEVNIQFSAIFVYSGCMQGLGIVSLYNTFDMQKLVYIVIGFVCAIVLYFVARHKAKQCDKI